MGSGISGSAIERRLRLGLYRFDCPSPLSIGEYVLDVPFQQSRTALAGHVVDCRMCTDELRATRVFLAATEPAVPAENLWQGLRRVVATLFVPMAPAAYGMARGSEQGIVLEYRAGPLKIVIGDVPGRQRGTVSIDGLILHDAGPPDALANREVSLQVDGRQLHTTRTDDLGSFAFEDLEPGTYTLAVILTEQVVIAKDIRAGR
jgi:hypothetical protein